MLAFWTPVSDVTSWQYCPFASRRLLVVPRSRLREVTDARSLGYKQQQQQNEQRQQRAFSVAVPSV